MQDEKVHPSDRMTSRGRLLAAYRGAPVDRLPYWPKIFISSWLSSQPAEVRALPERELYDRALADGIFRGLPKKYKLISPHVRVESSRVGSERCKLISTPDGNLTETWGRDADGSGWYPTEHPIKSSADLARYRWLYQDVRVHFDEEALRQAHAEYERIGQRGIAKVPWGSSPLMQLLENAAGPQNCLSLLTEHPGEMEELIELMHQACLQLAGAVAEKHPADVIVSLENTSTVLLGAEQFKKYCAAHLRDYGHAIQDAGKIHEIHMCGRIRALLPEVDALPASSIEALTAPDLGDVRLCDGRRYAPSKTLVGGTNSDIWLMPVEEVKKYLLGEVGACPDHKRIILTTAEAAPPDCALDKFRAIGEWIPEVFSQS